MDFDTIFLLGPQGSGKGTQGKLLAARLGFFFWDTGAILREMAKEDTPLAKKISVMNQGVLLSDEVIIEVAKEKLATIPPNRGIIFDGIPRRVGQMQYLLDFVKEQKRKRPITLFLDAPREVTFERLLLRAEKEGRLDDTREGIEARLRHYEEDTTPVLEILRKETTFISVDGRPSVPEIEKNINAALGLN